MRVIIVVLLACIAAGCSSIDPWVMPYEREALADPIMSLSREPMIDRHRQHVYEVREGARGASAGTGGGCGCN
jgi:hypothetical protein